uniref:Uncharacterized protein n=1 Tax=Siphoviridae sp. ctXQq5 TaxID=2826368 RepID=A0A8S5N225_9CAUD|nr:MAG TPA: hypothetical protein [Siphoviridae sp. ctXQq5]
MQVYNRKSTIEIPYIKGEFSFYIWNTKKAPTKWKPFY